MTDAVEYPDLVVVGAGLFGLTVAQQAVEHLGARVEIIDVRDHIGGNAYSYMDEETGAEIHKYGAHLFHTSNKRVWDYVNRFTSFTDYVHRVYATHDGEVYPLPINLGTINQFFHARYTPAEAKALVEGRPANWRHGSAEPQRQGHFADRPSAVRGVHQELHGQAVADRSEGPARWHHQPPAGAVQLRQPVLQGHVGGPAHGRLHRLDGAHDRRPAHPRDPQDRLLRRVPSRTTGRPWRPRACRWCTRVRWTATSTTRWAS